MGAIEEILKAIARLEPGEQVELAARLLERLKEEGRWPPRRTAGRGSLAVELLFDGGSLGNPGPGYGSFILQLPDGREVRRALDFGRAMTNNEAEYATLIAALEEVHRLLGKEIARAVLTARGDSLLVTEQVQGRWKAREPRMRELQGQVLEMLRPFRDWRLVRVPRREVVRRLGH